MSLEAHLLCDFGGSAGLKVAHPESKLTPALGSPLLTRHLLRRMLAGHRPQRGCLPHTGVHSSQREACTGRSCWDTHTTLTGGPRAGVLLHLCVGSPPRAVLSAYTLMVCARDLSATNI